ncbi:MAG: Rho termination factor N-terminal domain-containing protein, partial [Candidatus Humimicrobiaceae bacterium]
DKTISDLQVIAKNLGISGLTRLKKSNLIEKILAITDPQPQVSVIPEEPQIEIKVKKPESHKFSEDAEIVYPVKKIKLDDSFAGKDSQTVEPEAAPEEAVVSEGKAASEKEKKPYAEKEVYEERMKGILDILGDGYGFLRTNGYLPSANDIYVSQSQIRKFHLRQGDEVFGVVRPPKDNEKYNALLRIEKVDGMDPDSMRRRIPF